MYLSFLETVASVNDKVNALVWGLPMLLLLVGTGLFLSARTGFVQFRHFGYAMRNTLGRVFHRQEAGEGELTPFQAVSTALAATVGTGNIVGVTGAIILGGPGAVFWMWVSALVGMATKYAEVLLSVRYRQRNAKGEWVGGPMYYIENGLGRRFKWLSVLFCLFGVMASFGIGNIAQINSIAGSVNTVAAAFSPAAANHQTAIAVTVGLIIAGFTALILLGGLKRIGAVTEKLVPFMAAIYIVGALAVIIANASRLGGTFALIFQSAFRPQAILGGTAGGAFLLAVKNGVGRGVFSNEAGLGSAPIAHAASSERDPVRQGLYGIFEVFMDTIVICTLTSLAVLTSGVADGNFGVSALAGVGTTISAFATLFGERAGSVIIAIGLMLFATSTILSWSLYGVRCWEYLFGSRAVRAYQIVFILVIVLGASMQLDLVWSISDTLNGLMAVPNLVALLGLSTVVGKLTRDHFQTKTRLS